jgi:hypothetical protein
VLESPNSPAQPYPQWASGTATGNATDSLHALRVFTEPGGTSTTSKNFGTTTSKHTVPRLSAWTAPATPTNSSTHHKPPVSSATTPPLTYPQHYSPSPTTSHHYPQDGNAANGDGTPSGPGQTTTSATTAPEDPQALKKPRGTIDHHGDPHELVNSTEAARILGYAHRKHLPPDLLNHADHTQHMTNGRQHRTWRRQTLWNWRKQIKHR